MIGVGQNIPFNGGRVWGIGWTTDTVPKTGIAVDFGSFGTPTTFTKDGTMYLLVGTDAGTWYGYSWNGSSWSVNTSIKTGIANVQKGGAAYFEYGGNQYLVVGTQSGAWAGYVWGTTSWVTSNTPKTGLSAATFGRPCIFNYAGDIYMIHGRSTGVFVGYKWDTQYSYWASNSSIISGLGDIGAYSTPTVFMLGSTMCLITGKSTDGMLAYTWGGSSWTQDTDLDDGLTFGDGQSYAAPNVFEANDEVYLLAISNGGYPYGWIKN